MILWFFVRFIGFFFRFRPARFGCYFFTFPCSSTQVRVVVHDRVCLSVSFLSCLVWITFCQKSFEFFGHGGRMGYSEKIKWIQLDTSSFFSMFFSKLTCDFAWYRICWTFSRRHHSCRDWRQAQHPLWRSASSRGWGGCIACWTTFRTSGSRRPRPLDGRRSSSVNDRSLCRPRIRWKDTRWTLSSFLYLLGMPLGIFCVEGVSYWQSITPVFPSSAFAAYDLRSSKVKLK